MSLTFCVSCIVIMCNVSSNQKLFERLTLIDANQKRSPTCCLKTALDFTTTGVTIVY